MNLIEHAKQEFRACGWIDAEGKYDCEMQEAICADILALLEVFGNQGHSGTTAPYVIGRFKKLASFEPLVPLTGEDNEWNEISPGRYQNRRCSHVFKDGDHAYDIEGKVFREPDGCCYTSRDSRVDVTFPYTPKTEYVDVPENNET